MDLELSDEQRWLSESVETLLGREAEPWASLVEFGALTIGGDDGLGAVELCLIARALGAHLAPVPYLGSAAVRFAAEAELGNDAVALAVLEPGASWAAAPERTVLARRCPSPATRWRSSTRRPRTVSPSSRPGRRARCSRSWTPPRPGSTRIPQPVVRPDRADVRGRARRRPGGDARRARRSTGWRRSARLLAAAEAVGAAGRMLDDACAYAAERRQFGRTIGSFQALRHLLADMYVRQASSWSSVLYAAAALDEGAGEAPRTVSIAKAYVSRAAREVAHGAMQVFGGIAVTAEHPAHRYLRRIIVRERQFGDAAHHERALGRELASTAVPVPVT